MHAPLPRNSLPRRMREDVSDATRALVRACAIAVIISVGLVSIVSIIGELVGVVKLPYVEVTYTLFD